MDAFTDDVTSAVTTLYNCQGVIDNLAEFFQRYSLLGVGFDDPAPAITKSMVIKPVVPWFTDLLKLS